MLCAALLAYQSLINHRPPSAARYVAMNLGVTAALLAAARWNGLTADDLGLAGNPSGWRHGARVGVEATGVLGLLLSHPAGRRALRDERMAGMTGRTVAGDVLLRIPLGTVVLEELAFRGVLPALGSPWLSCLIFGLWHIAPTRRALDFNRITAPCARAGTVTAACIATALAGAYLCRLRRQYGLAASVVAHAAVNGLATIAAVIAHRLAGHAGTDSPSLILR